VGGSGEVAAFRALLTAEGAALMARLVPYDEARALETATRLRSEGIDPALAAAALTQARLRSRAVARLGPRAARMWFTADGLEQATRATVAERHAARYAAAGLHRVADLCCGVGSDLVALAAAGVPHLVGVDRDELTAAVARANTDAFGVADRVEIRCADVTSTALAGVDGVFVDPARRTSRGRALDPRAWSPPLSFVLSLTDRVAAVGAKLAPGVPHGALPGDGEAEWVSDGGDVLECALWRGPLATPGVARRATLLPSGVSLTGSGGGKADVGPVGAWLVEPDGAVIRAGLVAEVAREVGGRLVDPTIAYVTCDDRPGTPFGTAYEVLEVMQFGVKRLREALRSRGVGRVTVKKRGTAVTPEELRRQLRLRGDAEATVVLTRVAGRQCALLVERAG
jgi:hypothetical protein